MNRNQLSILLVVLIVLGAGAWVLLKKDAQTRRVDGGSQDALLANLPVGEELATVLIRTATNTVTLTKQDGVWGVNERGNYPANYTEISRTVLRLRDLKATQTEAVSESQLGRLELLEPDAGASSGTRIEFRDGSGQSLGALLLGKQHTRTETVPSQFGGGGPREVPVGRWVRLPENTTRVALVAEPLSNIRATPESWLDKTFFKVEKIRSIDVDYPEGGTNSFRVARESEGGTWAMAGLGEDEELDSTKTSSFNYALSSPSFTDVIPDPNDADLGLDRPTRITIETFDDFRYTIDAGSKTGDAVSMRFRVEGTYPRERESEEGEEEAVKAEADRQFAETLATRDEKLQAEQVFAEWTYEVSSWTLDSLLKNRAELVKVREPEPADATDETPALNAEGLTEDLLDF